MNKYLWTWSLWIAVIAGLYTLIYFLVGMASYNVIWMTFVALPIYFGGGGKVEEFPHYLLSAISGVIWGMLMLWGAGALISTGISVPIGMTIAITVGAFLAVGIHMILLGSTWFNKVPAVFAGCAMAFSQNLLANTGQIIPVIVTITGGLFLVVLYTWGGTYLQKVLLSE